SLRAIQGLIQKSPVSAQILFFFIEKMGKLNNSVICSYQTLMEVTGYSRPTVARAIKHLKDNNWIDTVKVGSATAYCVNAQIAWRAANNQRHYAIFSSTVVATSTENPDFEGDRKLRNIPHELNSLIGKSIQQGIPDDIDEYEPEELEDPELDYRTLM
ncbi:replication/maintenance protein RepL, partial [Streptococcus agalactiae]